MYVLFCGIVENNISGKEETMNWLWAAFIAGQILNGGNINYQQQNGYYEINQAIYSKHPDSKRVWITKGLETGVVYGLTKIFPDKKKEILTGANFTVYGFIISDKFKGIHLGFRW